MGRKRKETKEYVEKHDMLDEIGDSQYAAIKYCLIVGVTLSVILTFAMITAYHHVWVEDSSCEVKTFVKKVNISCGIHYYEGDVVCEEGVGISYTFLGNKPIVKYCDLYNPKMCVIKYKKEVCIDKT